MSGEELGDIEAIFHERRLLFHRSGRRNMMDNNINSPELLHYCASAKSRSSMHSSAATYGGRTSDFIESREYEKPLNVYGYSKFLFT